MGSYDHANLKLAGGVFCLLHRDQSKTITLTLGHQEMGLPKTKDIARLGNHLVHSQGFEGGTILRYVCQSVISIPRVRIILVNDQLIITTMICGEGNYARNALCV